MVEFGLGKRVALVALFLLAASLAAAQDKVALSFLSSAPRSIWIQAGEITAIPANTITADKSTFQLPIKGTQPTDTIYILDRISGNLTSKKVQDVGTAWVVDAFPQIAVVEVKVQVNGKPAAAANVYLDDKARPQSQLIDPSSNGIASFYDVKPGTLHVKVEYRAGGKAAEPIQQDFEVSAQRPDATPTLNIALPEDAATGSNSSSIASPASTEKPADKHEGSVLGAVIGYIFALMVGLGIAYAIITYFKNNPDSVGAKLEQLGVQIPKPGTDPLTSVDPVTPIAPRRPDPPQRIMLDDSAPTPLGSAPLATIASAPTGQPRLVAENGDELPLADGALQVGREVGLGLSLVGESSISRRHAEVIRTGSSVSVKDLGSTNGTFVNGARVSVATELRPGDVIQFGAIRFRYEA